MHDWVLATYVLGLIALWVYPITLYYTYALTCGVGLATDEQHRITLLSPWYWFVREVRPRVVRIGIGLTPVYFVVAGIPWYFFTKWYTSPHAMIWRHFFADMLRYLPVYLGVLLLSFGAANLFLLRLRNIFALSVVSTVVGVSHLAALWGIFDFAEIVMSWKAMSLVFFAAASFGFCASVFYVRLILDRNWFSLNN